MNALTPIVTQLDDNTLATVHELARARGISDAEFAADAIRRVAESDNEYHAFVTDGIVAADRGDVVTQEAMERWFEDRVAARRA